MEWTKENYKEFKEYLLSIKEEKYREFHSSLCLGCKYPMLGIRLPILRKICKNIENPISFLKVARDDTYEEVLIQGLVISRIKDEEVFYKWFKKYIYKIDNWAICDTFCNSIKIVRKYSDKYFREAIKLSLDNEEFISRVGLIMILCHFVNEENINIIFNTLDKIKTDKYYINMGEAWLICECFIKYRDKTLEYLKDNKLNSFTHNKSISKIHDSYRVSDSDKEYLNSLKRK